MANGNAANANQTGPSRYELMAREPDSRVIRCKAPDSFPMADLVGRADGVLKTLRNRSTTLLPSEQVDLLIKEYCEIMMNLDDLIERMHEACKFNYKRPRTVVRIKAVLQGTVEENNSSGKKGKESVNGEKDPAVD